MAASMQADAVGPRLAGSRSTAEEFARFYTAEFGPLVAQLYALTGDLGEAQDAAQEAFVRAWGRWSQVCGYENPHAWVHTVGYRVAVSRWRRSRNALLSWRRHGPPPDLPDPQPTSVALVAALRQVPEAQRRCLVQHYIGGLPLAEIAAAEGCAVGTIKTRLSRGRAAMAALLSEPGEPQPGRVTRRAPATPIGSQNAEEEKRRHG